MQKVKKIGNLLTKILYFLIPIGLLLWSIQTIFNDSLWVDEVFSILLTQKNVPEMIYTTAIDVHPPLYYLILKLLLLGNTSSIWMAKFVSFIPIGLLVIISYRMIPRMFGKKTTFLFSLFLLGMPQMMKYAVEIRMYSWGILTVTLCFLFCIKWIENNQKRDLVFMTIFALLSAYIHYFAAVSIGCIYLFVLIRYIQKRDKKRIKQLLFSIGALILLYLPWMIVLLKQVLVVKENYWIEPITINTIKNILQFPWKVNSSVWLTRILGIFLLISLLLLAVKHRKKNSKYALLGISITIGTISIGLIASFILRPIFISRYMICSLGCFWIGFAIIWGNCIEKANITKIVAILITVMGIYNIYNLVKVENNYKLELQESKNYLNTISSDILVFDDHQLQRVIAYYYPNTETYVYQQEISDLTKMVYNQVQIQSIETLKEIEDKDKTIYLLVKNASFLDELKDKGYSYQKCGSYQIETYRFSVYQLHFYEK